MTALYQNISLMKLNKNFILIRRLTSDKKNFKNNAVQKNL